MGSEMCIRDSSEAVFFQYQGDDKKVALFQNNGRPVTRIKNVCLTNIAIAEDIYKGEDGKGFTGSKLNLFLRTQSGATVMLTSGLTTMWSQCMVTALMGLYASNQLSSVVQIDTWKGNSNLGTYFAAIRNNGIKASSQALYDDLAAARSDRNKAEVDSLIRNAIQVIAAGFEEAAAGSAIEQVEVAVAEF